MKTQTTLRLMWSKTLRQFAWPAKQARLLLTAALVCAFIFGCAGNFNAAPKTNREPTPTLLSNFLPPSTGKTSPTPLQEPNPQDTAPAPPGNAEPTQEDGALVIDVNLENRAHPISALIYGLSGGDEEGYTETLRPTLSSWGGNPSTRYNWKLGNAWNAGKDWYYQNGNYGNPDGVSVADNFLKEKQAANMATRLAVPTLGWVAKDTSSCSFPKPDGSCGNADGATCQNAGEIANPETANTRSTPETIAEWIRRLKDLGLTPTYVAMDNEPELWGLTHYDVHPTCTTYEEVLEKYLAYAAAIRAAAPEIKLAGPVACCWFSYWNIAPGPAQTTTDTPEDYIAWFLQSVRTHDKATGRQSIDALDVHFYPQSGVYNDNNDPETAALRLRSTRALWDPTYVDESWINQPIYFIPQMKALIDQYYPGLELGISEWNWGADATINGALTIAEVLGIYGREGVDYAAYWRNPPKDSPGFLAFKLYTNYDDVGSRFVGESVQADSNHPETISSYAAYDADARQLKLMLINKDPGKSADVQVRLNGFTPQTSAQAYRLLATTPQSIIKSTEAITLGAFQVSLPAYSILLLVLSPQ